MIKGLVCFCTAFLILTSVNSFALPIAELSQLSPTPTSYSLLNDFYPFLYTGVGSATASLQYVELGSTTDFTSFTSGNIALIERGALDFGSKVLNAETAGAVGAIIYDSSLQDEAIYATLQTQMFIPSVFATRDVGLSLLALLNSGNDVVMHMVTNTSQPPDPKAPVPEPSTILLLGGGLAGLAFYRRKRK